MRFYLIDGLHLTSWRPRWKYSRKEYVISSIVGSSRRGWLTLSSTNMGNNLAGKIPTVQISPLQYLTDRSLNSFFISPVTHCEIENEIPKLKIDKATGPFSIPVIALKILKTCISKPLETIFNISFITGIVPSHFKLANVIPIHKGGPLTSISN